MELPMCSVLFEENQERYHYMMIFYRKNYMSFIKYKTHPRQFQKTFQLNLLVVW